MAARRQRKAKVEASEIEPVAVSPVVGEPGVPAGVSAGVSGEALALLMQQMQALMVEVGSLRAEVASRGAGEAVVSGAGAGVVSGAGVDVEEVVGRVLEESAGGGAAVARGLDIAGLKVELEEALANPVAVDPEIEEDGEVEDGDLGEESSEEIDAAFAESHAELLTEVEDYNALVAAEDLSLRAGEVEAVTAEETGALLAELDAALSDLDGLGVLEEPEGGVGAPGVGDLGGIMSADEIAALVAQAAALDGSSASELVEVGGMAGGGVLEGRVGVPQFGGGDDPLGQVLSGAAGAAPLDLAGDDVFGTGVFGGGVFGDGAGSVAADDDPYGDMDLSEDMLAELVRMNIAAQAEELDAGSDSESEMGSETGLGSGGVDGGGVADQMEGNTDGGGMMSDDEISAMLAAAAEQSVEVAGLTGQSVADLSPYQEVGGGEAELLSASELAALLEEPDPEDGGIPESSTMMADDELHRLIAEANALTGLSSGVEPVPTADLLPEESGSDEVEAGAAATHQETERISNVGRDEVEIRGGGTRAACLTEGLDFAAVKAVPMHLAVRAMALPVGFSEGKLVCRVAEPVDRGALDRISKATGFGVVVEVAGIDEVVAGLRTAYAEVQDATARWVVMAGADSKPSLVDRVVGLWKRIA